MCKHTILYSIENKFEKYNAFNNITDHLNLIILTK